MATSGKDNSHQATRVTDIAKEPQEMLMPIEGFEKKPLVSLEEAVKPLVPILPKIQNYAYVAKERCKAVPADGLTRDQSASIMLYTMGWEPPKECLYHALNATLRAEDRRKLKQWFSYLKLIITALMQLPSTRDCIYRGVNIDLSKQCPTGKTFIWWGFSSCTSKIEVLDSEQFLDKTSERTIFTIHCHSGKNISRHSYFQSENEILILPARQFEVTSCLEPAKGLHMVQLKETEAPITLLDMVPKEIPKDLATKTPYEPIDVPVPANPNKNESEIRGSPVPKPKPKPKLKPKPKPRPISSPKPKIEAPTYHEPPSMLL